MVRGKRQLGLDGRVPRRVDAGIKDHQGVAFLLGAGRRLLAAPCVPGDGAAGNGAPTSRLPTAAGDLMVEIANDRVDAVASGPGTVTLSPWREIEAELGSAGTQDLLAAVDAQLIKAGKRARYAAELASPGVVDGKGTNSCRTSWATTRTGASPAALLRRLVTATAHHSNENGFTYGLLYAHEQHRDTGTTGDSKPQAGPVSVGPAAPSRGDDVDAPSGSAGPTGPAATVWSLAAEADVGGAACSVSASCRRRNTTAVAPAANTAENRASRPPPSRWSSTSSSESLPAPASANVPDANPSTAGYS